MWVYALSLIVIPRHVQAQPHDHPKAEKDAGTQEQVALTGQLVDAMWFFSGKSDADDQSQSTRATNRLVAGTPAGLLPEGAGKPEDIWYLVTNSAPLAPYAGKSIKVEGRRLAAIHAIEPSAIYVQDGGEWRQIQLRQEGQTGIPPQGPGIPTSTKSTDVDHAGHKASDANQVEPNGAHQGGEKKSEQSGGHKHDHGSGGAEVKDHRHDFGAIMTVPPLHPVLVNFTAGLFPVAVLADWLGRLFRRKSLHAAAWWVLLFAAAITPLTALAGWLWYRQLGDMGHVQMHIHPWLGLSLAILLPTLAVWRGRIYARDQAPTRGYLISATVVFLALIVQGHLGATMSFPREHDQSVSSTGHV